MASWATCARRSDCPNRQSAVRQSRETSSRRGSSATSCNTRTFAPLRSTPSIRPRNSARGCARRPSEAGGVPDLALRPSAVRSRPRCDRRGRSNQLTVDRRRRNPRGERLGFHTRPKPRHRVLRSRWARERPDYLIDHSPDMASTVTGSSSRRDRSPSSKRSCVRSSSSTGSRPRGATPWCCSTSFGRCPGGSR